MSEAVEKTTTLPPLSAHMSAAAIATRVRELFEALAAAEELERATPQNRVGERRQYELAGKFAAQQWACLSDLIFFVPAMNLADATALLMHSDLLLDRIQCSERDENFIDQSVENLRRVFASVIPLVADAAGISLAALSIEGDWSADHLPTLTRRGVA